MIPPLTMTTARHCQIPYAVEKIFSARHCSVAYLGGSITVGVGASNVAKTSFRALFNAYLYREYHPIYHCQVSEVMAAIGASESYVAVFMLPRHVLPPKPDLAFVEFCVNDRVAPDKDLVVKGMEGMVRQLLAADPRCDVVILGTGDRTGAIDHTLHRRVAEHYDVPFVDLQGFVFDRLRERGQTWDDVALDSASKDAHHVNDYGNRLYYEGMRACFEQQLALYWDGRRKDRRASLPPPLVSDELQHVSLIDPSREARGLRRDGRWEEKHSDHVPWYFDNLLVGHPGDGLTLTFRGTAVAVFGLMYHNGLKLEATLDGREIPGSYLRHTIEFGKGLVLAHGLPLDEHELRLTVAQPSTRHNKLESPTAQIGYLGIACPPG